MNLASLIRKDSLRQLATATATPATFATHEPFLHPTLALANDTTQETDRWCWPHSSAMNGGEIDTFIRRLSVFAKRGLSLDDRESLADRLVIRDRESDNRRACLECMHFNSQVETQGCGNWEEVGIKAKDSQLSREQVRSLQLCNGFKCVFG